jgi:hypothetical protein
MLFPGWGRSSAGRAPALQAGGHRFDPGRLHHSRLQSKRRVPHGRAAAAIVCLQTMRAGPIGEAPDCELVVSRNVPNSV